MRPTMRNRTKLIAMRMNIGGQNMITTNYRDEGETGSRMILRSLSWVVR